MKMDVESDFMKCKECKCENKENAKYCVNCGKELKAKKGKKEEKQEIIEKEQKQNFTSMMKSCFYDLKDYLLKPLEASKSKDTEDIKKVAINGAIISLVMTIITLFKTMISVVRVTEFSWLKGSVTVWRFENLKNLNYFSLIFKNFFIYALVILALAFVFYVGSLIIKKQVSYQKYVSFVLISFIPTILGGMILTSLISIISIHLGVIVAILSSVYTITILVTLINDELKLEGYQKVLFNAICFGVILCISYLGIINISLPGIFQSK